MNGELYDKTACVPFFLMDMCNIFETTELAELLEESVFLWYSEEIIMEG